MKHIQVAIGLVWKGERLLITRRPDATHLGGLWEFPGGKLTANESTEQCVVREVREEVGIEVMPKAPRAPIHFEYPDRKVTLHPIDCEWARGEPTTQLVTAYAWVLPSELKNYEFPEANSELLRELMQEGSA